VVGAVTRLVPVKGLDVLVQAARRVVDRFPEARFVLVGRGRERAALERQLADLRLKERVILAGERLDVEGFYRMFDLFALSSHSEGCPNAILEAMRFGLPIVATRVGGVPELARDGESALLTPDGDADALAKAIARLLADPALARRLADRARDDAREFTVPAYVAKMQDYYEELYAKARPAKGH
jgi:glycosyltransferase involved in cell wall biosynthesis